MLTNQQIARFELYGLLPLPQALPAAKALAMRDRLWAFLSVMHGRKQDESTHAPRRCPKRAQLTTDDALRLHHPSSD